MLTTKINDDFYKMLRIAPNECNKIEILKVFLTTLH